MSEDGLRIKKQRDLASRVLDTLRNAGYSDVLVCGGAPRDWVLGKPANDIDVYVGYSDYSSNIPIPLRPDDRLYQAICEEFQPYVGELIRLGASEQDEPVSIESLDGCGRVKTSIPDRYRHNPHLRQVWEFDVEGETFQFMDITDTTTEVGSYKMFPFNMVLATYDGSNIKTSHLFDIGIRDQVLCKISDEYEEHETYTQKIKDRFSHYTYYKSIYDWFEVK